MPTIHPFSTKLVKDQLVLQQNYSIHFTHARPHKFSTYLRAGLRIGKTIFGREKSLQGTEDEIIAQIHNLRYHQDNPYVITGGHFSQIFVRNLGIFFNALLDPRIHSTPDDWYLRQSIALKTLAHDLEIFHLAGREYTTITRVKKSLYTGLDLYARPSDSLHAIVYTLNALLDKTFIETIFPMNYKTKHSLQSQTAAKKLLQKYKATLTHLVRTYYDDLIDSSTGLIKKDLLLASARDGIKRQSSFYDNVIIWATIRLATKLGLQDNSEKELSMWKKKILETFWNKKEGIFYDDLSKLSEQGTLFSADSFIALGTRFLNPQNKQDRTYLLQMIAYVKKHKLDKPFPLPYSTKDLPNKLYRPVRHFAPSYMGTSIWSHWGMEYIKTLIYLAKDNPTFLRDARKHLAAYKGNIKKYGGYPEVYDKKGEMLKTRLYRSVLHNGWVINYEQTKMLYTYLK